MVSGCRLEMSSTNLYEYWIRAQLAYEICVNNALDHIIHNDHNDPSYIGLPKDEGQLFNILVSFKRNYETALKRVIYKDQWNILCPQSGKSDIKLSDATSKVNVIRYNLPGLPPPSPPNGWHVKTVQNPVNKAEFCIVARELRNKTKHGTIYDLKTVAKFNSRWDEIEAVLIGLQYRDMAVFYDLKTGPIDPYVNQILKTFEQKLADFEEQSDANTEEIVIIKKILQDMQQERCFVIGKKRFRFFSFSKWILIS